MKTLDLYGAAQLLLLHPNTVRLLVKDGKIPGSKVGNKWVFIDEDLERMIRDGYADSWQMSQGLQEKTLCESTKEMASTTQTTKSTEEEYGNLLKLPTKPKPSSSS